MKEINQAWARDISERLNGKQEIKMRGVSQVAAERMIEEGLIWTYPPKVAIEYLKSMLDYDDLDLDEIMSYEKDINNVPTILHLTIPVDVDDRVREDIVGKADKIFKACGYSPATYSIREYNGATIHHYQYEADWVQPVSEFSKKCPTLFHMTASVWQKKIETIGLVPSRKNKDFSYSDRIYFIKPSSNLDVTFKLLAEVWFSKLENFKKILNKITIYPAIFTIGTRCLPQDMRFYEDPMMRRSYYTKENIKPEFLKFDINMSTKFLNFLMKNFKS